MITSKFLDCLLEDIIQAEIKTTPQAIVPKIFDTLPRLKDLQFEPAVTASNRLKLILAFRWGKSHFSSVET